MTVAKEEKVSEKTHILYIEDDRVLARIFQGRLEKIGYKVDIAPNGAEGLNMFRASGYHALVVDYNLPVFDGLEIIRILSEEGTLPPTIMLTATGSEKVAVEALKLGAADYLLKESNYLELIPSVISQVLNENDLKEAKRIAEEKLRMSEETNRAILEAVPDLMLQIGHDGIVSHASRQGLNVSPLNEDFCGRNIIDFLPADVYALTMKYFLQAQESHQVQRFQFTLQSGKETLYFENRMSVIDDGEVLSMIREITARVRAEIEKESLIQELQEALATINTLGGLIPICAQCKSIRDDGGYWQKLEKYITENSEAQFSHSVCPDCIQDLYPDYYNKEKMK